MYQSLNGITDNHNIQSLQFIDKYLFWDSREFIILNYPAENLLGHHSYDT